jgi:hypothetical protein
MTKINDTLLAVLILEGHRDGNATDALAFLIQTGVVWELQGSYQRDATSAIANGIIDQHGNVLRYPEDGERVRHHD